MTFGEFVTNKASFKDLERHIDMMLDFISDPDEFAKQTKELVESCGWTEDEFLARCLDEEPLPKNMVWQ